MRNARAHKLQWSGPTVHSSTVLRWRFVIHGGIDGYSRKIVDFECSANNCATSVLNAFLSAIDRHGLLSRVR